MIFFIQFYFKSIIILINYRSFLRHILSQNFSSCLYVNLEIINEESGNVEKEQGHDETAKTSMREGMFFMMVLT